MGAPSQRGKTQGGAIEGRGGGGGGQESSSRGTRAKVNLGGMKRGESQVKESITPCP